MIHQLRNRNFYLVLGADLAVFTASLFLAYEIRFAFVVPAADWERAVRVLPLVLAVKAVVFFAMGAYRGMWRYTSIPDAWRLVRASVLAGLIVVAGLTILDRFEGYPRSVFVADAIFTAFFCSGLRIGIRSAGARKRGILPAIMGSDAGHRRGPPTRLLIVGAGDAAGAIIREIQGNPLCPYEAVVCVDDDPGKHGRSLLSVEVRGPIDRLQHFAKHFRVSEILIAMPSASGEALRRVVAGCEATGLPFKTLPSLSALVDGRVSVSDVRAVRYDDLLGRPPVRLDMENIGRYLTGRTVAVTGAGGSIGFELCRQIVGFKPAALVLIDAGEFNLYRVEQRMRRELRFDALHPVLGRVQDQVLMTHAFRQFRPNVVFHAAAYKHVPIVELNPWEGIFNNVLGSRVIMDVAGATGVERLVLISSDKAVRPTNVMGACKRMAEIVLQSRRPGTCRCMAVRFGNVVGSSGSVVPAFQRQIRMGGPVTVTDPRMTRYFMTIPEACQLILQAGAMGNGGEVFVLEMGTPVNIAEMARDLIRLSGKVPDQDIKIVYTGLRPGEKLEEELITAGEEVAATPHPKIMVLKATSGQEDPAGRERRVREDVTMLVRTASTYDGALIKAALKQLIPEYAPSGVDAVVLGSVPGEEREARAEEAPPSGDFGRLGAEAMELLNAAAAGNGAIGRILSLIQNRTRMEAVAIRLRDGEDYPYCEAKGFPESFLAAERRLCQHDADGNTVRDADGNPVLACMCGRVIRGETDPALPFFTEGGSFWTNGSTKLKAELAAGIGMAGVRGRCQADGYESVALVPLRCNGDILGLIQLNDRREDRLTPGMIRGLEGAASHVAAALHGANADPTGSKSP